jgi:hypothetical protein
MQSMTRATRWAGIQFPGDSGDGIPGHADGAYIRRDHVAKVHAGEIIGPRDFIARALSDAMAALAADKAERCRRSLSRWTAARSPE